MFPHQYIHKHTWTSHNGKTHNQIDRKLIDRRWHLGTGCTILHGSWLWYWQQSSNSKSYRKLSVSKWAPQLLQDPNQNKFSSYPHTGNTNIGITLIRQPRLFIQPPS